MTAITVRASVVEVRPGHVEVDVAGTPVVFDMGEKFAGGMTVLRDWTVCIDDHADYGDFVADPAGWVQRYYRDEEVDVVNVSPCPCGGSYVDGVCWSCDSCSGCAECAPKHSYADSVSHEVLSVDVQRFGAGSIHPASIVARVRVRYSYPDAPDAAHTVTFSSEGPGFRDVFLGTDDPRASRGLVVVDDPARFGSFSDDPVSWVHSFYA